MKIYKFFWLPVLVFLILSGCGAHAEQPPAGDGIYFLAEDGTPLTGWQDFKEGRFYLSSEGMAATGIRKIGEKTYLFSDSGVMQTGWTEYAGGRYYLRSDGSMVTGWFSQEGQRYYLTDTGAFTGVRNVEDSTYVFDKTGKLTSGWADLGGDTAYGDLNGHPLTGWQEIDGKRYHFSDGGILSAHWMTIDGFRYYFHANGSPAQGKIIIDGVHYSFASNGQELILVNPWNSVPEDYTVDLTSIGQEHQIASVAYADFVLMMDACRDAGMRPVVCSSYRTVEYQEDLYQNRIERYIEDGYSPEEATELAGRSVAVPGTSEHHLGLAVDIVDNRNWNLDESQAKMPTQQWLMENSWRYGWILRYPDEKSAFTGIIYEPWHYRYVGREIAAEIHELGICLEEYLIMLTPGVG